MTDLSAQSIALSLGVSALVTVACRRARFPALLPLLAVGLTLGPSGAGLIDGASLGEALKGFITVAIGLLIFEGALHLNRNELSHAPRAVWGLLTIGALITWCVSAALAHWVLGLSTPIAIVLGAALIVTGPTVVQPILRLVRVSPRLHAVLSAEAVLIDPIGVVATVATLEVLRLYLRTGPEARLAGAGFWIFLKPLVGGAGVGVLMGIAGHWLLRRADRGGRPDPQLLNLLAVGVCMTCVGVGEVIAPDAGLAAVTICGIWMARAKVLGATELRAFKELLATILVGTLFVLLASRFDVHQLRSVSWREGAFVVLLLVAVRPLCVLASTLGSKLTSAERVFAALFAPRGIVALSVIAVASADLAAGFGGGNPEHSVLADDAARLERIMFLCIAGTVLLGTTLSPVLAWALRVRAGRGNAVILVGAHALSLAFARALRDRGIPARLIDSNAARAAAASQDGLDVVVGDATDTRWLDDAGAPHDAGWVIAWTGNDDVDQVAARWGEERYGEGHSVLWSNKPVRGGLQRMDIRQGEGLGAAVDRIEAGELAITDTDVPSTLRRVLAWIDKDVVKIAAPGDEPFKPGDGRRFIGLREAGAEVQPQPAAPATGAQNV